MTNDQKKAIEELRKQFNNNCKLYVEYGSSRICNFKVYMNAENPEDQNITIVVTAIDGVSDNFQPYIKTSNIMIEPDGANFNMSDVFPDSKVVEYVQKLKKIN
jgi:hypothetical protein